jgi:hypothetical protein
MLPSKKPWVYIFALGMGLLVSILLVKATALTFTVHGGEEETRTLSLAVEDHVLIRFTVLGSPENSLHFYILYPNGTVKDFGKQGDFSYSFVCDLEGEYVLHFSSTNSSSEKLVTLDYEVQHYVFGVPQMLFLAMIIVVISMMAVAAFIFMGKPH